LSFIIFFISNSSPFTPISDLRFSIFNKKILSLLLCPSTVFDGMVWTVVVTGEATQAFAIVRPLWVLILVDADGVRGACLLALSTTHTTVGNHMKRLVS
jgi:hypothetical protein